MHQHLIPKRASSHCVSSLVGQGFQVPTNFVKEAVQSKVNCVSGSALGISFLQIWAKAQTSEVLQVVGQLHTLSINRLEALPKLHNQEHQMIHSGICKDWAPGLLTVFWSRPPPAGCGGPLICCWESVHHPNTPSKCGMVGSWWWAPSFVRRWRMAVHWYKTLPVIKAVSPLSSSAPSTCL